MRGTKTAGKTLAAAMLAFSTVSGAYYIGFGAGGGLALPVGPFAEAAGPSIMGAFDFTVCVAPNFYVRGLGAYRIKYAGKENEFTYAGEYKSICFRGGITYRFVFHPTALYAEGAAGASRNDFGYPYRSADGAEHVGEITDFRPLLYAGGGFEYRMTQNVALDVCSGVTEFFGGKKPAGVKSPLKETVLITIDFAGLLKYYFM